MPVPKHGSISCQFQSTVPSHASSKARFHMVPVPKLGSKRRHTRLGPQRRSRRGLQTGAPNRATADAQPSCRVRSVAVGPARPVRWKPATMGLPASRNNREDGRYDAKGATYVPTGLAANAGRGARPAWNSHTARDGQPHIARRRGARDGNRGVQAKGSLAAFESAGEAAGVFDVLCSADRPLALAALERQPSNSPHSFRKSAKTGDQLCSVLGEAVPSVLRSSFFAAEASPRTETPLEQEVAQVTRTAQLQRAIHPPST